jgi:hypothetical protein
VGKGGRRMAVLHDLVPPLRTRSVGDFAPKARPDSAGKGGTLYRTIDH